jgi:N-acetylmuramoyl-L-alanine amidase
LLGGPVQAAAVEETVIYLDPGHGGDDTGIVGGGGLTEKAICLDLAQRLKEKIDQRLGHRTYLTRKEDVKLSLDERAALANNHRGSLFISIHLAGFPDPRYQGVGVFFPAKIPHEVASGQEPLPDWDALQEAHREHSEALAGMLHRALIRRFPHVGDLGMHPLPLYPLAALNMPAVLVEPAVLSSAAEEEKLGSDAVLDALAEAIFEGIDLFLKSGVPGGRP